MKNKIIYLFYRSNKDKAIRVHENNKNSIFYLYIIQMIILFN